jgi:hypothetical protein
VLEDGDYYVVPEFYTQAPDGSSLSVYGEVRYKILRWPDRPDGRLMRYYPLPPLSHDGEEAGP